MFHCYRLYENSIKLSLPRKKTITELVSAPKPTTANASCGIGLSIGRVKWLTLDLHLLKRLSYIKCRRFRQSILWRRHFRSIDSSAETLSWFESITKLHSFEFNVGPTEPDWICWMRLQRWVSIELECKIVDRILHIEWGLFSSSQWWSDRSTSCQTVYVDLHPSPSLSRGCGGWSRKAGRPLIVKLDCRRTWCSY